MATSLSTIKTELVTFTIQIAGADIPTTHSVSTVYVMLEANRVGYAKLRLSDGGVATDDKFASSEATLFEPGAEIAIKAGYSSTEKVIFKGIIISHGLEIDGGKSFLVLECKHKAIKMTGVRKNAIYVKKKDSEIITTLLTNAGINESVKATTVQYPEIIQHNISDWDFMLLRADINGLIVVPKEDKLAVIEPKFSASAGIEVEYGNTLIEANIKADISTQFNKAIAIAWDSATQKLLTATSNSSSDGLAGNWSRSKFNTIVNGSAGYKLQTPTSVTSAFLDKWSTAKMTKASLGFLQGTVKFQGYADLKVGDVIDLKGMGKRFTGKGFVGGVEHEIEDGSWTTTAHLGMSDAWYHETMQNVSPPDASGIISPFKGLTVGIVTKIDGDPDSNYRIQIKIPTLQQDNNPVWARISSMYAQNQAGVFFMPEVDDEVIVGFFNEDPQSPVILGSLYNKKNHKTPTAIKNTNEIKTIVTKEKLTIEFNEKDKIITLKTPGGNKILLDDKVGGITIEDKNGNKIVLGSSGIKIEAAAGKDIAMKGNNIKMEAQMKIEAKGTTGVDIAGLKVSVKGDVQASIEAATAELKGSAMTTIKGGIVMIN